MSYHACITRLTRLIDALLAAGFLALIVTVAVQVVARGVLKIPLIWTLDLAQLLFSWLIFIGAAVAYQRHAHYIVDLLPEAWLGFRRLCDYLAVIAALIVIYLLVVHGWKLVDLRWSGKVQTLGISRSWMFVPMPVAGVLIALFLVDQLIPTSHEPTSNEAP
ncbi:TRAP transporter small permease [Rhodobacteraceae bacterium F11138]|nr:TRAP transporter small permease [Rhodobacteraceae bacterium F11138]